MILLELLFLGLSVFALLVWEIIKFIAIPLIILIAIGIFLGISGVLFKKK